MEERKHGRKSRSFSMEAGSSSLSPASNTDRKKKESQSPKARRHRGVSRSNSQSKKENAKKSSRSRSRDVSQCDSSTKIRKSAKERLDLASPKAKSYLASRTSSSDRKDSEGRKSNVLGSLNTFLDEVNNNKFSGRSRDAQSVVSSSSKVRRRSHTPSSASVIGGMSISREDLRIQRRLRSSSTGAMDRVLNERRKPSSNRSRDSSNESRQRANSIKATSSNVERSDKSIQSSLAHKSRKDSSRVRSRSASVSEKVDRKSRRSAGNPKKSRSAGALTSRSLERGSSISSDVQKAKSNTNTMRDGSQATILSRSDCSNTAPGFPVAAVNGSMASESSQNDETEPLVVEGSKSMGGMLDSTTRLREKRTRLNESAPSMNHIPSNGGERTRRNKRRSQLHSTSNDGDGIGNGSRARAEGHSHAERRKTLRASVSESDKPTVKKPSRRLSNQSEQLTHRHRKKSLSDYSTANSETTRPNDTDNNCSTHKTSPTPVRPERKVSRHSRSAGPLIEKALACNQDAVESTKVESTTKSNWWSLSKIDGQNGSTKSPKEKHSTRTSTGEEEAYRKKTTESSGKGRLKKFASRASALLSKDSSKASSSLDDDRDAASLNDFQRLDASTASLDFDLLANSPVVGKNVKSVDQLFENHAHAKKFQSSKINGDGTGYSSSCTSDSSSHCQSDLDIDDRNRVSWVELPLHDPKQLLVKTTDFDGGNETSELSTHVRGERTGENSTIFVSGGSRRLNKAKSNPSLEAVIGSHSSRSRTNGAHDERTMVTTATAKTDATNTSASTVKTTNLNPAVKKPAKKKKVKSANMDSSHGSLTIDQLSGSSTRTHGSSGSLSRSSKGSKESSRSKGSLSESNSSVGKTKSEQPSNSRSQSNKRHSERSNQRAEHASPGLRRRTSRRTNNTKPAQEESEVNTDVAVSQFSGESTVENSFDVDSASTTKRSPRGSPGSLARKKSYLNRRSSKVDKAESLEAKTVVDSSLNTLLQRMEQATPKERSDDRSVYSSMRHQDHRKRYGERKPKRSSESKVGPNNAPQSSLDSAVDHLNSTTRSEPDADNMSITSAPILSVKNPGSMSKRDESQRPVVNLKKTQFSSKLNKMHVAF